jgi:putative transposase
MPSRNILKIDIPHSYYHVYARGGSRQTIYNDAEDYSVFLNLFKRYLSKEPIKDPAGRKYPHFAESIELLAFCLMPNHFHILLYQHDEKTISSLMRGLMTSYSRYFNKKYNRSGPLFESRYKSSRISDDAYLMHISRYIHLNPKRWKNMAMVKPTLLRTVQRPRMAIPTAYKRALPGQR